jgi:DNA-binding CsgD family transcriptional regulator
MKIDRCKTVQAIENIEHAATIEAIWPDVKAVASSRGFDHLVVLRNAAEEPLCYADLPGDFVPALEISRRLEPRPHALAEFSALSSNLGRGFIVPVYFDGRLAGAVLFCGQAPDLGAVTRSTLHIVAQSALERIVRIERATGSPLTAREIECLRLAALGRIDAEIGEGLGISVRTARFHIDAAKRKLNVETRVEAITEAIRRNLIDGWPN